VAYTETKFSVSRFNADSAPQPEGLRCVSVLIPDDTFHLRLLAGLVGLATRATNWEGEQEARQEVALLWNMGYDATDWGDCVDCADVADCIENDEAVRAAINALIAAGTEIPATSPYGERISDERLGQDLSSAYNPTCDKDILWAQCTGIVDLTNLAISETLEKVEAATNIVELVTNALGTIPGVAGAEKAVGVDGALGLINYYQEAIADEYNAQYTEIPVTGTRDLIAFALFCACQSDCVITLDKIQNVMQLRLEQFIAVGDIFTFTNLLAFLEGAESDTEIVVDLAFFAAWKMAVVGNYLFGGVANHIVDVVIASKSDEPDNGWSLMGDCADQPWCVVLTGSDLETYMPAYFDGTDDHATWTGTGWEANTALPSRIALKSAFGMSLDITRIDIGGNYACPGGDTRTVSLYTASFATLLASAPIAPPNQFFGLTLTGDDLEIDIVGDFFALGTPITGQIDAIAIYGTGTPPTFGTSC